MRSFCEILGLDPLYMGNEGKLVLTVPKADSQKALESIRSSRYGQNACIVGEVYDSSEPEVTIKTRSGGTRVLEPLVGEGLPRIC